MEKSFSIYLKVITLLVVILLPLFAKAQISEPKLMLFEVKWNAGILVLANGEELKGTISITMPNDNVRLTQQDGSISSYMPGDINMLEVSEAQNLSNWRKSAGLIDKQRTYKSYIWNHDRDNNNFKSPALFVSVVSGKYGLLLREEKQLPNYTKGKLLDAALANLAKDEIIEKLYIVMPDKEVKPLRNYRNDFLDLFPDKKKQILKYAHQNRLEFSNLNELARIVAYVNNI